MVLVVGDSDRLKKVAALAAERGARVLIVDEIDAGKPSLDADAIRDKLLAQIRAEKGTL